MIRDQAYIERIVAEVLRRLNDRGSGQKPSETKTAAPAVTAQPTRHSGDLVLDTRVVTLASVQGRLAGIRRVFVESRAVVTPSVRDELRKRRIRLEKGENVTPGNGGSLTLWVGSCTEQANATRKIASLTESTGLSTHRCQDLPQAIQQLGEAVEDGRGVALLLTDQPLAAVCLANRNAAVRAAVGGSVSATRQALRTIAANVLIVDPSTVTPFVWKQMVRVFDPSVPRNPPANLGFNLNC